MLERIIENEYKLTIKNIKETNEVLNCEGKINDLIKKLKEIDSELANELDNEYGLNIYLRSKEYFKRGFELGLQLTNEIKHI